MTALAMTTLTPTSQKYIHFVLKITAMTTGHFTTVFVLLSMISLYRRHPSDMIRGTRGRGRRPPWQVPVSRPHTRTSQPPSPPHSLACRPSAVPAVRQTTPAAAVTVAV